MDREGVTKVDLNRLHIYGTPNYFILSRASLFCIVFAFRLSLFDFSVIVPLFISMGLRSGCPWL